MATDEDTTDDPAFAGPEWLAAQEMGVFADDEPWEPILCAYCGEHGGTHSDASCLEPHEEPEEPDDEPEEPDDEPEEPDDEPEEPDDEPEEGFAWSARYPLGTFRHNVAAYIADRSGVYRLWWPDRFGDQPVYIGQSSKLDQRLMSHSRDRKSSLFAEWILFTQVLPSHPGLNPLADPYAKKYTADLIEAKIAALGIEVDFTFLPVERLLTVERTLQRRLRPFLDNGLERHRNVSA